MRPWKLLLAAALAALAQQPDQPTVKFTSTTNLVIVDVFVRDRTGAAVEGLTKDDFIVSEDGKPQRISVFEFQRLATEAAPAPPPVLRATRPETAVEAAAKPTGITPSAPGQVRYRDRRLLVLFFDFSSMAEAEQIRARDSALSFLEKQMTPSDLVAILTFSTRLNVAADFTDDRDLLAGVIRGFRIGEGSELASEGAAGAEEGDDTGTFVADETEFNIFNTDRKLSALESAAKMLSSLPEKKALIYFSSGVGKTGVENQSQLRSTVNAAVRANVSFYPVDARGLMAMVPGGDASTASPRGTGIFTGQSQRQQSSRFNDQQETLYTLAEDTGGRALLDNNDLAAGIVQAQKDVQSYYILGYYSTNPAQDGRFRRLRVRLAGNRQARLDFRSGYFAPKEFARYSSDDKERQLEEALALGDPVTDLPLALEADYFRVSRSLYFVPVAVKIPGSEIVLARRGANEVTQFDFIGQVRDRRGMLVGTVRDAVQVKLTGASVGQMSRRGIQYDTGFTLTPGEYRLKVLARENQTGRMGTFETTFTVPDLNAQSGGMRLSSIVWGNQREPLSAAVGSAERQKKLIAMHPLIEEGQKLLPSITKVFRKDQSLYVYFEVYDPAMIPEDKALSVAAGLSFFSGGRRAFESEPLRRTSTKERRAGVVSFEFQVPLEKLSPGRYVCQVNVVDEVGRKFAYRRAPLVLLP